MKAANNYLKNVMKSVAYAAADVSGDYMSNIKEFSSTNKEFTTATYAALRNPSQYIRRSVATIQESKVYKALDYGARNLVEDLRTGNFYNKAREEQDLLGFSGLNVDDWDDLSDFGIDDNWESNLNSSKKNNIKDEITTGDVKIAESIEGSNAALASATVNAVISTSENEIKAGRANMGMLYMQNEKLFGGLHKDITVLGNTMQQMYNLQSASLQNIDKNLSDFFTQESKLNTERNAILKEILEIQRNAFTSAEQKQKNADSKKSSRIRWNDINVDGMPDLEAYFDAIKTNISKQIGSFIPSGFGEDSNMLAAVMTSPLKGVMKYAIDGLIPATVKAASKELDATISGVFGNIIAELGNARSKNENGLLSNIAKFFGVSTSVNRNIDTSRYEKGPVPFDGITRKAIVDIIPTHLRRIEAALTGRPEEMFDYRTGKWLTVSSIKKQYDDIRKNSINQATSDLRRYMDAGLKAERGGIRDSRELESWDKAVEEFWQFLYDNNGRFNTKASAEKNGIDRSNYPNLYKHFSKIKTVYKDFDKQEYTDDSGNKKFRNILNSVRSRGPVKVMDTKEAEERYYRSIESDFASVFQMYFGSPKADTHGKYDKDSNTFKAYNILNNTKDDKGNTVFNYLYNINKELMFIRANGVSGGGGNNGGGNNGMSMSDIENLLNKSGTKNDYNNRRAKEEAIRKAALEKINSGQAIDIRDFDKIGRAHV